MKLAHLLLFVCVPFLLLGCGANPKGGDDDDTPGDDDDDATGDDPCAKYATWEPSDTDDDDMAGGDDDDVCGDDDDASDDDDATGDDDTAGDDDTGDDDDSTEPEVCDDVPNEPRTVYMSADDSNSQAAPALARQWIREGQAIDGDMRPYEFLNYYRFDYPPAASGHVDIVPQMSDNGDGTYTILVGVVAPAWEDIGRRPRSLTFTVDRSGSMSGQPLRNVRTTMCEIAGNLKAGDEVSVVTWDSATAVPLQNETVDGPFDPDLMAVIDGLVSGGSTNLNAGLVKAYELAEAAYDPGRMNRVLLMSDGGANTGQTNEDLIALHAEDGDAEGIYMAGIGTASTAHYYDEILMNQVSDAGKGAYVYIDTAEEADRLFGDDERFLTVMEVAAREVQLSVTLPAGYVLEVFHGEEVSGDPSEVEPQHLSPDDAMLYHFAIADCDAGNHDGSELFQFSVDWIDPVTRATNTDTIDMTLDEMVAEAGSQLLKADAVVAYAQALVRAPRLPSAERDPYLDEVIEQVEDAYDVTLDEDLLEIADLLQEYKGVI
jgi:Ca-activated chloride channel homolog